MQRLLGRGIRQTRRGLRRAPRRWAAPNPPCRRKKIDGVGRTSTSPTRPSNCSERLRTKRGQCAAPGISGFSADIIWQPLQTPSEKLSGRAKNASNCSRSAALNRIDLAQPSPAPSTSPYEKPPQATSPLKRSSRVRPAIRSVMCTSDGTEPGAIEDRRHFELAVDALLAQDRDLGSRAAIDVRRRDIVGGIERQAREQAGILRIERACALFLGAGRVVTQRLQPIARLGPGRRNSVRDRLQQRDCPCVAAISMRSPAVDHTDLAHAIAHRPAAAKHAPYFDRDATASTCTTAPSSSANSSATAPA